MRHGRVFLLRHGEQTGLAFSEILQRGLIGESGL